MRSTFAAFFLLLVPFVECTNATNASANATNATTTSAAPSTSVAGVSSTSGAAVSSSVASSSADTGTPAPSTTSGTVSTTVSTTGPPGTTTAATSATTGPPGTTSVGTVATDPGTAVTTPKPAVPNVADQVAKTVAAVSGGGAAAAKLAMEAAVSQMKADRTAFTDAMKNLDVKAASTSAMESCNADATCKSAGITKLDVSKSASGDLAVAVTLAKPLALKSDGSIDVASQDAVTAIVQGMFKGTRLATKTKAQLFPPPPQKSGIVITGQNSRRRLDERNLADASLSVRQMTDAEMDAAAAAVEKATLKASGAWAATVVASLALLLV